MRDRLIKESDVINLISEVNPKEYSNPKEVLLLINTLVNSVNDISTAYNVDEVVEQLTVLKEHYHKCCLVDYNEGAEVGITEALAIVQAGGVE